MSWPTVRLSVSAWFFGGLFAFAPAANVDASEPPSAPSEAPVPSIDLFEGIRSGALSVSAEGSGDGRMVLSVKNRRSKALRVVLPPGLLASGASGQFGGGGFGGAGGGGFGGGGGGGGGGWRVAAAGARRRRPREAAASGAGGLGGGGRGSGTLPASAGMLMLSQLIINFCGDRDSWDFRSLSIGGLGGGGLAAAAWAAAAWAAAGLGGGGLPLGPTGRVGLGGGPSGADPQVADPAGQPFGARGRLGPGDAARR